MTCEPLQRPGFQLTLKSCSQGPIPATDAFTEVYTRVQGTPGGVFSYGFTTLVRRSLFAIRWVPALLRKNCEKSALVQQFQMEVSCTLDISIRGSGPLTKVPMAESSAGVRQMTRRHDVVGLSHVELSWDRSCRSLDMYAYSCRASANKRPAMKWLAVC